MPGSVDDLSFDVYPPAIDISTAANQQIFNPQFTVANTSTTDSISLTRALLRVPVTTTGTNLAQNTAMTPSAISSDWNFGPGDGSQGYAAFVLTPKDGVGEIPPGGSVAFMLTGVTVNVDAGTAVLPLEATTSAGSWTPTGQIQLTTPSTTPTITRYSITPADPRTLTTLQGQVVVLSWTTSGAAYCTIEDDQGNLWPGLPTSGTQTDIPMQGDSEVQSTPKLGLYYNRTYKLYANTAGGAESDEQPNDATIQLPTISGFSVTPAALTIGQQATATWSVANVDPNLGAITLALAPADRSGPYTIAIAASQPNGSGVVTPTPLPTTAYTLSVDNGYDITAAFSPQVVASPLPLGWQEMSGLETVSIEFSVGPVGPIGLVAFANDLWLWTSAPPGLYRTSDGTAWTTVATNPSLPPFDGLVVADLGDGEKLWALGGAPFLASSSDGVNWDTAPTPAYPARQFGNYVVSGGTILVLGGMDGNHNPFTDVWSTSDGHTWTRIGNNFPSLMSWDLVTGHSAAGFAGQLQAVVHYNTKLDLQAYSSSDGGKTWSQGPALSQATEIYVTLVPLVGELALFAGNSSTGDVMVMNSAGAWSAAATSLVPPAGFLPLAATVWNDCLWLVGPGQGGPDHPLGVVVLNQVLPGTTFTLTPPARQHIRRGTEDRRLAEP